MNSKPNTVTTLAPCGLLLWKRAPTPGTSFGCLEFVQELGLIAINNLQSRPTMKIFDPPPISFVAWFVVSTGSSPNRGKSRNRWWNQRGDAGGLEVQRSFGDSWNDLPNFWPTYLGHLAKVRSRGCGQPCRLQKCIPKEFQTYARHPEEAETRASIFSPVFALI